MNRGPGKSFSKFFPQFFSSTKPKTNNHFNQNIYPKMFRYGWSWLTYKRMNCLSVHQKKERRLLIQAIVSGIPCFLLMTCHHLIHFPLLEVLAGELCVGTDPIVYMWFNREIRSDFLEITGTKRYFKRFADSISFRSTRIYTTSIQNQ